MNPNAPAPILAAALKSTGRLIPQTFNLQSGFMQLLYFKKGGIRSSLFASADDSG